MSETSSEARIAELERELEELRASLTARVNAAYMQGVRDAAKRMSGWDEAVQGHIVRHDA